MKMVYSVFFTATVVQSENAFTRRSKKGDWFDSWPKQKM